MQQRNGRWTEVSGCISLIDADISEALHRPQQIHKNLEFSEPLLYKGCPTGQLDTWVYKEVGWFFLLCRQEVCAVFAQNFIEQERLQDDVILGLQFTLCRFQDVPTTLQLSQKIGFLGQVTQMFLGWFLGCSVSLQKCMVETAAGFCASHLHRINRIFMPSSVEVAKSFVSWLQIWDDWLEVGYLVGAISVSI